MFDGLLSILDEASAFASQTEKQQNGDEREDEGDSTQLGLTTTRDQLLEAMYIQACYWSFGACLVAEHRSHFDEFVKKTAGLMLVQDTVQKPATISKL